MSNSGDNKIYDASIYETESPTGKLARKSKEAPFMPIGLTAATLGVLYGFYSFRRRGNMPASIYWIHLRVAAQGTVVSAITLGVLYSMFCDYVLPKTSESSRKAIYSDLIGQDMWINENCVNPKYDGLSDALQTGTIAIALVCFLTILL